MTRLHSFSIEGLAGRTDRLAFELEPDLNVFWGLNGSGKTSMLRILHSALEDDATQLLRVPFQRAEVQFYSHNLDAIITRRIIKRTDLSDVDPAQLPDVGAPDAAWRMVREAGRLEWTTRPARKPDTGREFGRFAHTYLPTQRLNTLRTNLTVTGKQQSIVDEVTSDEAFVEAVEPLWLRLTNQSLTEQRTAQESSIAAIIALSLTGTRRGHKPDRDANVSGHLDEDMAFALVSDFLRRQGAPGRMNRADFARRYRGDPAQRAIVDEIDRLNNRLALAQERVTDLVELLESLYSGGKRLDTGARRLQIRAGDDRIPLSSLSSGEKQLLYILLECIQAEHNTVIIDEPELSMHLDWQQRLIGSIRTVNPDAQLVMATHSPEVIGLTPSRNIFEL